MPRSTRPGVVIAPRPLTEFVPLYKSQKDEIVTQWAMKEVERVGLLKMDFLGLSTLTLIRDALEEIKRTDGIDLDIDTDYPGRREDLQAVRRRADLRRVPVRELGHARAAAQGEAGAARRPHRPERALSSRPAEERDGGRLHRAQTGEDRGQVRAAAARADPRATPTASSPTRSRSCASPRCWPASRWASPTCSARPWGRKTPRSWRSSAKRSPKGPRRTGSARRRRPRFST